MVRRKHPGRKNKPEHCHRQLSEQPEHRHADNQDVSSILYLSFVDFSPYRAADILNTLIALYSEDAIKDKSSHRSAPPISSASGLAIIEQSWEMWRDRDRRLQARQ
jgi:hypothetical protein